MWSNEDVLSNAMTTLGGKYSDICGIDFFRLCSNASFQMRKKHGDFRDELVRRFPIHRSESSKTKSRRCRWTVELFSSDIIDQVIDFNHHFKSMPESHHLIFVCFGDRIQLDEEIRLKCSYFDSQFFQFDQKTNSEQIFDCLKRKNLKKIPRNQLRNFYPLLLHADSISTGLAFNYYYSYLIKQIGSTNHLFLTFRFNKHLARELFPLTISMKLKTWIEECFLMDCPSTMDWNDLQQIESKLLVFNFDPTKYRSIDENEINVTYSLIGTKDFGLIIQQIRIWQQFPYLDHLVSVGLKDDIRRWNELFILENGEDRTGRCSFHPISDVPTRSGGHPGVSTMKKTSKDSYDLYRSDHTNGLTKHGQRIIQILMVPVYYILMPSSCQFGPSDLNESDPIILQGTIIDPNIPDRIRLAYANNEVLRSPPMKELNRYLRRTFYYVDQINENNEVIRYLFCGEYPFILSTLDQMEKRGEISTFEKHDEYLRFCNILHRLIQSNNLSQSIQLIEYNDCDGNFDADLKLPWNEIKEDIDQWYSNEINYFSIESKILPPLNETPHLLLFFTDQAKSNPFILTLINDIKDKVQLNGFILEDAQGNVDLIENAQRVLFICTGRRNDPINSSIIKSIEVKMNKFGVFRDVFILINDAMRYFPCRFLRSIPYLTFDLAKRSPSLHPNEIVELIFYLKNMNILSKSYQINFEDINSILRKSPLQCTSVGRGCATAFYFNYLKLLISSPGHHCRIELIKKEIEGECLIDVKRKFLSKWIFVIPSIIENLNQIIPSALSIDENEQKMIGFQLSVWKSTNEYFVIPDLTITVGGIYQRSYSSLTIYQLINLTTGQCVYFPMEIPGALYALESQYQNVLSHFHFGKYDPFKQGFVFQTKVQNYFSNETDPTFCENIHFIYFDNSQRSKTNFQGIEIFLQFLWDELCLFI